MSAPHTPTMPIGITVGELLEGQLGRVPLDVALGIVLEVARLLERAHGVGHVHGCLSPHAVWCSLGGEVWLEWHPRQSPGHRAVAPELRHGELPSAAADTYALAALGYELLTGLDVSRAWARAPLIDEQEVASPSSFNGYVPPAVDAVITQALCRDPAYRPETIEALARAAEGTVQPGTWETQLCSLLGDSFYAAALREVPITCERAGAAVPLPLPLPPRLPDAPARLVVAEPVSSVCPEALRATAELEPSAEHEVPAGAPMLKIAIVTALAAAASLGLCLAIASLGAAPEGRGAAAAAKLADLPRPEPVALVYGPLAPPPGFAVPSVSSVSSEGPVKLTKVKAERSRVNKRSHTKRRRH